jgi:ABC-type Fe3+-hydroxamate transport system substrate-binding protein
MHSRTVIDQIGRTVLVPKHPNRIVSLVPSQTELLFDLGLDERVVGITKFCVHPEAWSRSKVRIGGTKNLNFTQIQELNPDLIIANKEENNEADIERLQAEFPVWVSDVNDLDSALEMIYSLSQITNINADSLISEIRLGFDALRPITPPVRTLYFIWKNPYMAAGSDTFIHDMLQCCGLENVLSSDRYPELSIDEIISLNPELILLSSEPFPFKEDHVKELQHLLPNARIKLVDGEMFSWYGSRLRAAPAYFSELIGSIAR